MTVIGYATWPLSWLRQRREERDRPLVDAEMAAWAQIRAAMGGDGVNPDPGAVQPDADDLRDIRPRDAAGRRISPERLRAREHQPAPPRRVDPEEEAAVDG